MKKGKRQEKGKDGLVVSLLVPGSKEFAEQFLVDLEPLNAELNRRNYLTAVGQAIADGCSGLNESLWGFISHACSLIDGKERMHVQQFANAFRGLLYGYGLDIDCCQSEKEFGLIFESQDYWKPALENIKNKTDLEILTSYFINELGVYLQELSPKSEESKTYNLVRTIFAAIPLEIYLDQNKAEQAKVVKLKAEYQNSLEQALKNAGVVVLYTAL